MHTSNTIDVLATFWTSRGGQPFRAGVKPSDTPTDTSLSIWRTEVRNHVFLYRQVPA